MRHCLLECPLLPRVSDALLFLVIGRSCLYFTCISQPLSSQNQEKDVTKKKEEMEPGSEVSRCYGNNVKYYLYLKYPYIVNYPVSFN